MIQTRLIAAALVLSVPALAAAEDAPAGDEEAMPITTGIRLDGSARSKVENSMLMPAGTSELGGSIKLVAGGEMADGRELSLTDLSLLHLHARRALGERFEIAGGVELLLKEPEQAGDDREPVLQGASLGARMAVGTRYAIAARAQAGPQIGRDYWGEATLLAQARRLVHETMVFQGAIGGAHTAILGDDDGFITEAVIGGDVMLRTPRGEFGLYAGVDYRIPVVSSDELDAPVRLSVAVGSVYAVVPTWDLFVEAAVVDRGDAMAPATTLPILDGGRDQRQLVVGVAKHFADGDDHTVRRAQLAY